MSPHLLIKQSPAHSTPTALLTISGPVRTAVPRDRQYCCHLFSVHARDHSLVQFLVLAIVIAVVLLHSSIVQTLATGIANALGVH